MTTFFTSDTHISHQKLADRRGFDSIEEMDAAIIYNWNSTVGPEDTVFMLGDICLGSRSESLPILDLLHGKKILVCGNHDNCSPLMGEKKVTKWMPEYMKHFCFIAPHTMTYNLGGQDILLCHFPYAGDRRYPNWRPKDAGQWLLHGHLHSRYPTDPSRPRQIDVGMEAWGLTPVAASTIADMMAAA